VTNKDITEALKREHKIDIDRAKIQLPDPVKTIGTHSVEIRLLPDVRAKVRVAVEPA
jgi:large subunit ribosomal protein L9